MRRTFLAGALGTLVASHSHAQTDGVSTRVDFESPVAFQPMLTGKGGPVAWSVIDDPTAPTTRPTIASRSRCSTYFVIRANALEDNVRLYRVVKGDRQQFAGANVKVPSGVWQELRLFARGSRFEVFLEGRSLFDAVDTTFATAGRIALRTKADSVTFFDDLRIRQI